MTISRSDARRIAEGQLAGLFAGSPVDVAIMDEHTREEDFGWVFFYESKTYLQTGDFRHRLVGNGPLIVDRAGRVHQAGTAKPIGHYIRDLRQKGSLTS